MDSSVGAGRKRGNATKVNAEDQALDIIVKEAEERLAAKRIARAEAREIRLRELERQQKEIEEDADRAFDMQQGAGFIGTGVDVPSKTKLSAMNSLRGGSGSTRRSSEDSSNDDGRSDLDMKFDSTKEVEERFRKAMITNAQLDNERAAQTYQIQLLKDKLEDVEELCAQLQREIREKNRDYEVMKRSNERVSEELRLVQAQLKERDQLIAQQGLEIVVVENEDGTDAKCVLVSSENAKLFRSVDGSLESRLQKLADEKYELVDEINTLKEQLQKYKTSASNRANNDLDDEELQREVSKALSEYKYKLQKAEQEIINLQASLARSETQVIRYKSTAEAAEKAETELKTERRKLQRENREMMERMEELETANNHLLKRMDKLKNAKSSLLKEL